LNSSGKYYFISDAHLGIPDYDSSLVREKKLVKWLDVVKSDAKGIFLLGDIFDFWFEYCNVVPKYFVRLLGKIAEVSDLGIPVWFFTGNHDMWTFGYLEKELGVKLQKEPLVIELFKKRFFLAHGDGLGPKDYGYKMIKSVFRNNISRRLFALLHPRIGFAMAKYSSSKSRLANLKNKDYLGDVNEEFLLIYTEQILLKEHFDFCVFGHRHLAIQQTIGNKSTFINLGDWLNQFTYGEFDGKEFTIKTFDK
jgi:UDP-2,3-diacylglucosamine hydrolase